MNDNIQASQLTLRLLGYYNGPDQKLNPETEQIEFANALGELLSGTFSNINDPNDDPDFASALETGVFLMRDRESHLYAFWPKERVARITGVMFNREALTILPLEYKYWFVPGEEMTIAALGSANSMSAYQRMNFFEYLRSIDSIGKQVRLDVDFLTKKGAVVGELITIGKDFLTIRDAQSQVVISNHMCFRIQQPLPPSVSKKKKDDSSMWLDMDVVSPKGVITHFDKIKGLGWIRSGNRDRLGFHVAEIIDERLRKGNLVGSQVVFTEYESQKGMKLAVAIHLSGTVDEFLELSKKLREKDNKLAAKRVLLQVLDEYPDNFEAAEMLKASQAKQPVVQELDEDASLYEKANDMLAHQEHIEEAIDIYMTLIGKGKHAKDCISRVAAAYWVLYNQENDEEVRSVIRKQLYDFLEAHHDSLGSRVSLNLRLQNYYRFDLDEEYDSLVDSVLNDPSSDMVKKARMYYFKAQHRKGLGEDETAQQLAEESLYLNPFNNKAELLLPEMKGQDDDLLSVPIGRSYLIDAISKNYPENKDYSKEGASLLWMKKTETGYPQALLNQALVLRSNQADQQKYMAMMVEYMAMMAQRLATDKRTLDSAIYVWGEVFAMVPKFGYFSRVNLSMMLAAVLNVSANRQGNSPDVAHWKNICPWTEILDSAGKVDKKQWKLIIQAIHKNKAIMRLMDKEVKVRPELRESFFASFRPYEEKEGENLFSQAVATWMADNLEQQAIETVAQAMRGKKVLADQFEAWRTLHLEEPPFSSLSERNVRNLDRLNGSIGSLRAYFMEDNPDEREKKARDIQVKFDAQLTDLLAAPTLFGIEGMAHTLLDMKHSLLGVQSLTLKGAIPTINVEVMTETVSPDADGFYTIGIKVSNAVETMSADNVRLELISRKMKEGLRKELFFDKLEGGSERYGDFKASLFNEAAAMTNWGFAVKCMFDFQGKTYTRTFTPLQVHLAQQHEMPFIEADNPYTYGTKLKPDDPTFVGRKADIDEIVGKVLHPQRSGPQLVVYGQKRCGKSSLVDAVMDQLEKEHAEEAWCVYLTLIVDHARDVRTYNEASFYLSLLKAIWMKLNAVRDENKPVLKMPAPQAMQSSESPTQLFCETIMDFKLSMASTPGWEHRRLVMIIDEFSVLYNSIKQGVADANILHHWKGIQESEQTNFATIFVGHDIIPTFFAEPYATNSAAIIERYRLTYLDGSEARELIDRPTQINGESRFDEKAIQRILYYTAGSPSYLQIFMRRMVEYINERRIVKVSDIDVFNVAKKFIEKEWHEFNSIHDFDNLINSGLDDTYCTIKDDQFVTVLRIIARATNGIPWCDKAFVASEIRKWPKYESVQKPGLLDEILDDLDDRNVIERKENNQKLRIKVGLFKEWLIRN